MIRALSRWRAGPLLAAGWTAIAFGQARGQNLEPVATTCGMGSEVISAWCQEAILAVQAAQGTFGLAAAGGADLPGSASTLGWRMVNSPRFALSVRGATVRSSIPALRGGSSLPSGEETLNVFSGQISGTLGVFDGFSLAPTVGGVLSLDLSSTANFISASRDQGFQESLMGWGVGARLGILRESFSLPGVSFSAFHRWPGRSGIGEVEAGDPVQARFDVQVTSFRGMIGKDLWGIGVFGGLGCDRTGGEATVRIPDPGGELPDGVPASFVSWDEVSKRRLIFLGASRTFLALQLSAEVGRAEGFDPNLPGRAGGDFDPGSTSYFGSLALRLTF